MDTIATVSSTLQLFDSFSGPMMQVINHVNQVVSSMQRLEAAANGGADISQPFTDASSAAAEMVNEMSDVAAQATTVADVVADIAAEQEQVTAGADDIVDAYKKAQPPVEGLGEGVEVLGGQTEEARRKQEQYNNEIKKGENNADGLLKKVIGFVAAYAGYNAAKNFFTQATAAANDQIRAEQRLQSIMSNINGMTQDGIELVKQRAVALEGPTAIAASVGITGQSQLAEYVYDPKNIVDMTEAMYNLATETYGVNVSADQLTQTANLMGKVMMGDINALARNGFKMDAIFTKAEQKLLKTGTEAERAAMIIEMIDENLAGLAEAMGNTPEGQILKMQNAFGAVQEKIGYGLLPMIGQLAEYIVANMPVIEAVFLTVFSNALNIMQWFVQAAITGATFIIDNWSWIEPVLWGVAAAFGVLLIATQRQAIMSGVAAAAMTIKTLAMAAATAATMGLAAGWQLLNATMRANIIIFIIMLVVGLITWLVSLWKTNDEFAGAFMAAWNNILNFFDQIPIFFMTVGYGIANAFDWAKVESLKIMEDLVNGAISRINWLINKLNKIPGVSLEAIGQVEFAAGAEIEAEARRQARAANLDEMRQKAGDKAAEREQKRLDKLDDRARKRAEEDAAQMNQFQAPEIPGASDMPTGQWDVGDGRLPDVGKIDKVKEVGKIKDKVDISSEDLKVMRDLAEMRAIQNFVTLTPTVQVTTGPIMEATTIDYMLQQIEDAMDKEIAAAAKGHYE